jgi:hypothetical protein
MQYSTSIYDSLPQINSSIYILKMIHGSGSGLPQVTGIIGGSFHAVLCQCPIIVLAVGDTSHTQDSVINSHNSHLWAEEDRHTRAK